MDIDAAEAAVADVKKTFLLGQRADAFESEYVTETEATINELPGHRTIVNIILNGSTAAAEWGVPEDMATASQLRVRVRFHRR